MWKLLLVVLMSWTVGCGALEDLINEKEDGNGNDEQSWDGISFEMETTKGVAFELLSKDGKIDRGTNLFLLCGDDVARVASVRLWMPGHNHGSTPVQVQEYTTRCREISSVNFGMEGSWQVQVVLDDDDEGAFSMKVAE
jgi:hypothetical protein